MEPTVTLFVGKRSQQVEFIVMVTDGFIMRALPGAHRGSDVGVEYWTTCPPADLAPFLTANYEVSRYLWDSAGEGTAAGPEFDFEDGLAWEVPPVQSWAKGEPIPQAHVLQISEYLGDGDEFTVGDIAMEFPEFDGPIQEPVEMVRRLQGPKCLWCGIMASRAYNFTSPDYDRYAERRHSLTNPILWTDGVWYDQISDPDFAESTPTQFGDSLLTCMACSSVFLASELEAATSASGLSRGSYPPFISPGSVAQGELAGEVSDLKIVHAGLEETLGYLKKLQKIDSLISWAEWVSAQQLVGLATYEARCGRELSPEQDKLGRELLTVFCGRIGQILEGTIGSMYAGADSMRMHLDPNYFLHQYPHEEEIPLANMYRIVGDFDRASRGGRSPFETFEELEYADSFEEITLYAAQRQWLLAKLISKNDTRWAVASNLLG